MHRKISVWTIIALMGVSVVALQAQEMAAPTGKTLAATMDVYVFPSKGQAADQQSKDESECYNWAVQNTGNDPFSLSKQSAQNQQQAAADMQAAESAGRGSGAQGAVRGAAAGALIGEIANDDAGGGAAAGAAVGLIRGRRRGREEQKQAEQQAEQRADTNQAATAGALDNFKKAFSVCLEAKDYMVKY